MINCQMWHGSVPTPMHKHNSVGCMVQWWNAAWPANFPCSAINLQLIGDYLYRSNHCRDMAVY